MMSPPAVPTRLAFFLSCPILISVCSGPSKSNYRPLAVQAFTVRTITRIHETQIIRENNSRSILPIGEHRPTTALAMAAANNSGNNNKSAWRQDNSMNNESSSNDWNCVLSIQEIEDRIRKRNKARRARNFALADDILAKLHQNGVFLDDKTKLWRVVADGRSSQSSSSADTGAGNSPHTYEKAANSKEVSQQKQEYILQKIQERSMAKLARNYDAADDILDELRFLHNVVIDDQRKTWRVSNQQQHKTMVTYGGSRLQNVPRETLQKIELLVKDRAAAKKEKNYERADEILDVLKVQFGVRVDDSRKAWFFLPKSKEEREKDIEEKKIKKQKKGGKSKKETKRPAKDMVSDWSVADSPSMPEAISISDSEDDTD